MHRITADFAGSQVSFVGYRDKLPEGMALVIEAIEVEGVTLPFEFVTAIISTHGGQILGLFQHHEPEEFAAVSLVGIYPPPEMVAELEQEQQESEQH